ncbi:MAG TPA: hypothetical protein VH643_10075 [Gemmataceae bacterium]|jgi:hypothetical protein
MVKPAPQTIRITLQNWKGLALVAEPFEPPSEVIDRLVALYELLMSVAKPGESAFDVARRLPGLSDTIPSHPDREEDGTAGHSMSAPHPVAGLPPTRPEPPSPSPRPTPPPRPRQLDDIILICLPGPGEPYQQSAEIRTRMAPHLGWRPTHIHPDLMRLANQRLVQTEKPNGWGYRLTPLGEARKNEIQGRMAE